MTPAQSPIDPGTVVAAASKLPDGVVNALIAAGGAFAFAVLGKFFSWLVGHYVKEVMQEQAEKILTEVATVRREVAANTAVTIEMGKDVAALKAVVFRRESDFG